MGSAGLGEERRAQGDGRRRLAAGPFYRGLEGVERASADVAIDDPERPDRHRP